MFALKYINRHLFMEHEGRLYLVDTGCPKSFAINGAIPWVDRTPHAVVLDMVEGRLRFAGENDEVSRCGLVLPFTKAPKTQAPILRCHPELKMIWDTGAQVGYIDMSTAPKANIVKEMGAFSDFSPTYQTIESPMTWLVRFVPVTEEPESGLPGPDFTPCFFCQMADARADILADIRKEGADGVLGNSWMGEEDSLTRMLADAEAGIWQFPDWVEGVIVAIHGRRGEVRINNLPLQFEQTKAKPRPRRFPPIIDDVVPDFFETFNLPPIPPIPMRTVARRVPAALRLLTAEGLRDHIQLDNIDGLIGNDLLQDTLL